jgi:hypothetical protein
MRLQTKSPDPESALQPSRTASQAVTARRHRGPGSRRSGARRPVRRCVGSSPKSRRQKGQDFRSGRSDRGTPLIPLTLRGMQGAPRPQAHSSARSFFLLPSVLALLALVLFPVAAHAECTTASCTTYEVESVPHVESTPKTGTHKSTKPHTSPNNPKAEGSGATTGTGEGNNGETGTEPGGEGQGPSKEGSSKEEGNPSTNGGGAGGGGNSNGGNGGGGQSGGGVGEAEAVSAGSPESSSGGSSPVVPILIAVAVLAAISIGVVLYRQRKSDQDTDGADGSVSSPNAS